MDSTFLTAVHIHKVRHLQNIDIPLSETERRHLIFTGQNGSGKTSVLESLASNLEYYTSPNFHSQEFNRHSGAVPDFTSFADFQRKYKDGQFILAFFKDNRSLDVEHYTNIEKVQH